MLAKIDATSCARALLTHCMRYDLCVTRENALCGPKARQGERIANYLSIVRARLALALA